MIKEPSKRKTPVRSFDIKLVHKGKSLTAQDLSEVFGIDESTVHRWHREEGLVAIDDKTPAMFHFDTLKQFLTYKNDSRKMEAGNEGDFPCLNCFLKKRPLENKITLHKRDDKMWNAKAICPSCGKKMCMGVPASDFILTLRWGYAVVEQLPLPSIICTNKPSDRTTEKRNGLKGKFLAEERIKFHPDNERVKHRYFDKVVHGFGKHDKTRRKIVSAVSIFEEFNGYKDFKLFVYEDAKGFQKYLIAKYSHSMQNAYRIMQAVRDFFLWLKEQEGYKKLKYDDINSLRLSLKDTEKAKMSKPRKTIDIEKWEEMVLNIKPKDEVEMRGRAMFATLLITGIRIDALISLRIGDLDLDRNYLFQDSNHVNTKFSSSHKTDFWKLKPEIKQIVVDWVSMLRKEHGFRDEDPLFPRIQITSNEFLQFEKDGFKKEFLKQAKVVRDELSKQFENANLDYYTPHTIRNSLTDLFFSCDLTMEQLKAVSQNLSHKSLITTVGSYFNLSEQRKSQTIEELDVENLKKMRKIKNNPKFKFIMSQMVNEDMINKVFELVSKES
ncbi:MAG: tyrosine-type recombinase/integrase [Rickettsiales bacterium]|nr:tyrosine-type recombinase/integrase [Rickettsiales bacterium]